MNEPITKNGINQSQYQHMGDNDFYPEVHVLAGTLVPVVSTSTW